MKINVLTIFLSLILFVSAQAQNNYKKADDAARISLTPVVSEQADGMPASARRILKNKLLRIATKNGMGGVSTQFLITAEISVLSKDITPTAPPMVVLNFEATFYIVDYSTKTVLATTTIEMKGVGKNENKAYISGIKNIKVRSGQFKNFVKTGKKKIIEYYNSKCDFILTDAKSLTDQRRFREAMAKLTSVPEVCKECYQKAQEQIAPIWQDYINEFSKINLAKAQAEWAKFNADGATPYLGKVHPDAACYRDAQKLVWQIQTKLKADEDRDFNFKLQKWNDKVSIDRQRIQAYRDVGMETARSMRDTLVFDLDFLREQIEKMQNE